MKRGFTLIETLVALGIIVVVLGSSVTANRVLLSSIQSSEDKVQMEGIADEGVQLMQLMERQEANRASGSIGNYFANNTTAQWVVPHTVASATLSTAKDVDWCSEQRSSVGYNGVSANSCKNTTSVVQICNASTKMSDVVALTGGELIGVRRAAIAADNTAYAQLYYSFTMARTAASDSPIRASDGACTATAGFDYYVRTMQVTRIQGPEATAWFSKPITTGKITNKLYRLTVSVSKYLDASIKPVTRSVILTDYYAP